jgi:uncharacterized protein YceH (UPF0502 family)
MLDAVELSAEELRVLGSLVEKRLTTPQQYPLTLNALVLACNQSSNRDPVLHYDEATVEDAVTRAKTRGLAAFVHPSHGRSALRYRHTLDEALGLDDRPLALLAVLVLRGPQTLGELRARTERMAAFSDLHEVEAELDALAARHDPLVTRLARAPGRKEERFAHTLAGPATSAAPADDRWSPPAAEVLPGGASSGADEVGALRAELHDLRAEVSDLRRELEALRTELGA